MTLDLHQDAIVSVLKTYFDGLYYADSRRLSQALHPDARYINTVNGEYVNIPTDTYFPIVDSRTPPAESGQVRKDEILSIEIGGPNMAFAKVKMAMMDRVYTDFLTLLLEGGRWSIIAKVFHYDLEKEGE